MTKQRDLIYVTEFKNQFDVYQLLHATRSKEKAYIDAGNSGRVIECIEHAAIEAKDAEIEELKKAVTNDSGADWWKKLCGEREKVIDMYKQENAKLKEQLKEAESVIEFYGRDISWTNSNDKLIYQRDKIYFDKDNNGLAGKLARQYLKNRGER